MSDIKERRPITMLYQHHKKLKYRSVDNDSTISEELDKILEKEFEIEE